MDAKGILNGLIFLDAKGILPNEYTFHKSQGNIYASLMQNIVAAIKIKCRGMLDEGVLLLHDNMAVHKAGVGKKL